MADEERAEATSGHATGRTEGQPIPSVVNDETTGGTQQDSPLEENHDEDSNTTGSGRTESTSGSATDRANDQFRTSARDEVHTADTGFQNYGVDTASTGSQGHKDDEVEVDAGDKKGVSARLDREKSTSAPETNKANKHFGTSPKDNVHSTNAGSQDCNDDEIEVAANDNEGVSADFDCNRSTSGPETDRTNNQVATSSSDEVHGANTGSQDSDDYDAEVTAVMKEVEDSLLSDGSLPPNSLLREEILCDPDRAIRDSLLNELRFRMWQWPWQRSWVEDYDPPFQGLLQIKIEDGRKDHMCRVQWPNFEEEYRYCQSLGFLGAGTTPVDDTEITKAVRKAFPTGLNQFDRDGVFGAKRKMMFKVVGRDRISLPEWELRHVYFPSSPHGQYPQELLWSRWCEAENAKMQDIFRAMGTTHGPATLSDAIFEDCKGQVLYICPKMWKGPTSNDLLCLSLSLFAYARSFAEPFEGCLRTEPIQPNQNKTFHYSHVWAFINPGIYGKHHFTGARGSPLFYFQARYLQPIQKSWKVARRRADGTADLKFDGDIYTFRQGFILNRQLASLGRSDKQVHFVERTLVAKLEFDGERGRNFSIMMLSDEELDELAMDSHRKERYAKSDGEHWLDWREEGTKQYLNEILRAMDRAVEAWTQTLDSIDSLVRVGLSDFLDDEVVESLMFDSNLTRSKEYFIVLQIFRIADEWLAESVRNLTDLGELFIESPFDKARRFTSPCRSHLNEIMDHIEEIRRRIATKTEEINTLKDALFNATSLREATRGMAVNQTIYIFTIVTVIFTPISFLATFFALPFLNNPSAGGDTVPVPTGFRNSFVILPILTYTFVLAISWWLRPDKQRYSIRNGVRAARGKASSLYAGFQTKQPGRGKGLFSRERGKGLEPELV